MPQPNYVILLPDSQGVNMVGAYGHPELRTPHIDALAREGTLFSRAYTTCPLCTPARAGLYSGIYAHTSGPWTNNLPFGDNIKTMGQRFGDSGYHTAHIGKWQLDGHDYFGTGICPPGWDDEYWYDGRRYLDELNEDEISLWRHGLMTLEQLREHNVRPEFTWAHRVSDRAVRFLQNQKQGEPFLLVASYDEPHHPYTCPPEYAQHFADFGYDIGPAAHDTLEHKPAHQREWAAAITNPLTNGRLYHPTYFGCNSFVDSEIGRVIAAVRQYASADTYILLTSDHGDMMGAHGLWGKGPVMYENIIHIPLIVSQPGGTGAGTVNHTVVSHIDLLPTMLDLAGMDVPAIMEGESLRAQFSGEEEPNRHAFMEFGRYEIEQDSWGGLQPVRSVVNDRHKLVINLLSSDELYDLQDDPAEMDNLIDSSDHAQIRDALHDRLLDWMYAKRDPFRGPCWERRPWRAARRLQWNGEFRPRPADGYAPDVRDYYTGLPVKGR